MTSLNPFPHGTAIAAFWLLHSVAYALPAAPATLTRAPSSLSGEVTISWSAVPGATGYNVKRGVSPTSALTTLATVTTTDYVDATATPGTTYFYVVTTNDASGESPPTRGIMASTGVIVDNGGAGTSFTGSWAVSSAAGYYGTAPVFASATSGSTPTATYTFTPDLPARGNFDIYMRWTTNANRATDTPVDLVFPDGGRTVTVNQELNNGVWMLLSNITAEAGTTASVTIRNNGANGNVVADAVQFVPRHSPRAPDSENLSEYTLLTVDDHFDGTALDTTKWSTFAGRGEHSVSDGRLHTKLRYKGTVPIGSATTADLEDETNWAEGGIIADHATKFGYHEARLRLPQVPARGVDTAYWHTASDELLNGYEIDAPEFFNRDSSGVANNHGFGVWDHIDGDRTWDYGANNSTLGDVTQYVTIGLEWRTDNTQVVYVNGAKVFTAPASGMNDTESILPSSIILSTKVGDWLRPNAALDGAEATWDYARFYQKPGFLGAIDGDWTKPENWGPDGLPTAGYAAVFNMPTAPAAITLATDQTLQSILLDGASLPAHTFGGTGALRLGAGKPGDTSATHGGILVNTTVSNNQAINNPITGVSNLQFANLSRTPGHTLFLNGPISGDGVSPRDVDFVSPISAATPSTGTITLGQALGTGIRHINRAGDIPFTLPANNQHTGELRIARGPVVITDVSSLGTTPNSAVEFGPRYKHSESWRPRLTHTGPAATSAHPIRLGGWQADGVLESSGTGPLTWSGDLLIAPSSADPKRVLTRTPKFTLGGTHTGENLFSGTISDAGVIVTYQNSDGSTNSGPAILSINKAGTGTWALGGNNAYSGTTSLGGGTLVVSSFNSVNGGTPLLASSSLGTPKTVENGTIAITSGTLKYTGPGETTDRVISLAGSSGTTLEHSGTGLLKFTGDLTSSASTKTLTLTGTGAGEISGIIPNNSTTNKTNLSKSGLGTWTLSGANTYTGTTTISKGTLVVNGAIADGGNLTVSTSDGYLSGSGSIATPSVINGTLVASPLTFTNTLTLGSYGKLLANFTANNANSIASVTSATVTINGAKVDVTLNAPGSTTNFLQSYWRSARTIPLLTATTKTGTFAIGTVTTDSAGNPAATYGVFTLQQTANAVNLVWTPVPGFPVIDDPTLALVSPAAAPVAITDALTSLRVAATVGGGASITWSQVSGPGTVTFGNQNSSDTTAQFSATGTYVLRATASNALGSVQTDFTVLVNPPTSMTFRQGTNGYTQDTTFIRGDSLSWNSGARSEFLVGRFGAGGMRGLLAFDLSSVPAEASVQSASLDLWMSGLGSGTSLDSLDLHELLVFFTEGSGDGSNATNGQGSGADWTNRVPVTAWATLGAEEITEFAATPLTGVTGINPSTSPAGTTLSFPSNSAMVSAATAAINTAQPLDFMLKMATDSTGTNRFARIASDDNSNQGYRPRLSLTLDYAFAPTVNPGTAPAPTVGVSAALAGSVANATSSVWSVVSGPGSVSFADASAPATTAVFSTPGSYTLQLTATNAHGETRRTLPLTVLTASTNLETWRQTHFTTTSNTGDAANSADPDFDGLVNLLEFATGTLPTESNGSIGSLVKNGENLEFTYPRSHAAVADGLSFAVEWSDVLAGGWSITGVSESLVPDSDNGITELWKATVPQGTLGARFIHLRVRTP